MIELLGKKWVLPLLLAIYKNPGASKTDITGKANDRTKYLRLDELIEHKLVWLDDKTYEYNVKKVFLTPKGQMVAKLINDLSEIPLED